jgi:hypothetical protein
MTPARAVDVLLIGGGIASSSAAAELRCGGFWYLMKGRLAAALAVGNPGHLDIARSLLRVRADLGPHRAALADPASDLAGVAGALGGTAERVSV